MIAVVVSQIGALIWDQSMGLRAVGAPEDRERLLSLAREAMNGDSDDPSVVRRALLSLPDAELVVDEEQG